MFHRFFFALFLLISVCQGWCQNPEGQGYEILLCNIDDVGECYINDVLVGKTHWGKYYKSKDLNRPGYSGWINVDSHLNQGNNKIRFILNNSDSPGGWGAIFQMRFNGEVFFSYGDSKPDSSPGEKINVSFSLNTNEGPPKGLPVHEEPELIVLSEGGADFDYTKVYGMIKQQYDFLVAYMGRKPTRPVVVHIGPDYQGMSKGFDMWMDSKRIYDTSHNYAHEMMHCFCRDYGHFPNWMFESLADVAYCESEVFLWKRKKEEAFSGEWIEGRSKQLNYLRAVYGRHFYRRFFHLVQQDLQSGDYHVRTDSTEHLNEDMIKYFHRAAEENVMEHLIKMGFKMDQF